MSASQFGLSLGHESQYLWPLSAIIPGCIDYPCVPQLRGCFSSKNSHQLSDKLASPSWPTHREILTHSAAVSGMFFIEKYKIVHFSIVYRTHWEFFSNLSNLEKSFPLLEQWICIILLQIGSLSFFYELHELKQTDSVRLLFQINRKMVNTIWFRFYLIRFRKYFSVCAI